MTEISPKLKMPNSQEIPRVGVGTSLANDVTSKEILAQIEQGVKTALRVGYRHIDTATLYGSEEAVGRAIKECISEGTVRREDIYVTTKLWSTCHRKELVEPALRESLQRLGLDYVDLYLVHWPIALQPSKQLFPKDSSGNLLFDNDIADHVSTWQAMEMCQKKGLTYNIGISNFNIRQTQRILDNCSIKPAMHQMECHPYHRNEELVEFCQRNGIAVTCWSPLCRQNTGLCTDPTLTEIATRLGRTVAQVALRFQLQRGLVVIPKSTTLSNQEENLKVFDFVLSAEDMAKISSIPKCFSLGKEVFAVKYTASKEYPFDEN